MAKIKNFWQIKKFLFSLLATTITISATANSASLKQQREIFLKAEAAILKNDIDTYQKLKPQLQNYPLLPFIEYHYLNKNIKETTLKDIKNFKEKYPHSYLTEKIHFNWLRYQAQRHEWKNYIDGFIENNHADLNCHYIWAQYKTTKKIKVLDQLEPWYVVAKSQSEACDTPFDEWHKSGGLTKDIVWQRFAIAIDKRKYSLAKYLTRFLPAKDANAAKIWLKSMHRPQIYLPKINRSHPKNTTIVVSALGKLAYSKPEQAIDLWNEMQNKLKFRDKEKAEIMRDIGLSYALKGDLQAEKWLYKFNAAADDTSTHEWRIRHALLQQDWNKVLHWIENTPEDVKNDEAWRYWKARALEQTLQFKPAKQIYQQLAQQRSYYGFLAQEKLNLPINLFVKEHKLSKKEIDKIITHSKPAQRALELRELDRTNIVRKEWMYLMRTLKSDEEKVVYAKIAQHLGWHNLAIHSAIKANYFDDIALRFPLAFQSNIESEAKVKNLNPAIIFAVARQESAFHHQARSPVGAMGLMQLMPYTAKAVAYKSKKTYRYSSQLLQPDLNISLGTFYLRSLLLKHQDNFVLAAAAYNAGPHRVKSWMRGKKLDADIWLETIPFHETRGYVKNVLTFATIYEMQLGKEASFIKRMKTVPANI